MEIAALAIKLRRCTPMEAADLGIALCRHHAHDVYRCTAVLLLPLVLLAGVCFEIAHWLPTLVLWWCKPWLDRSILFVLSRAAFGQRTTIKDMSDAQRQVWWQQLPSTLTVRRLSPWRALTQPVYQLEGNRWREQRKRALQIRRGNAGTGMLVASAFGFAELALALSLMALVALFTPGVADFSLFRWLFRDADGAAWLPGLLLGSYALVILVLEPFYVASGFGMYLNRRVELEAWDIEQELRRAHGI